jgi:hypothetical protein
MRPNKGTRRVSKGTRGALFFEHSFERSQPASQLARSGVNREKLERSRLAGG